ncbi:hypothetical protein Tco_0730136 [Tanacetum coccineum]|uniref:Uncharacterized protein n=1 Tax=Tanacetum coccineum TaxID=301880 RepID=A0ABQ4YRV3_9ASTR
MGRDTIQLETAVSTISSEYLLEFTSEYRFVVSGGSYWDGESLFRELRGGIAYGEDLLLYMLYISNFLAGGYGVLWDIIFLWDFIFPAGRLVSAGCTMVLLVVIFPAGRLVSAGCTMVLLVVILPAGRMVSAGCTMVLLEVIVPAGFFVPAGSYGLCCW